MKKTAPAHYLLNIVFLLGFLVLVVNDHLLKSAYGNWWTGKLSDFAGVLILPLFLKYLSGWRNGVVIGLTVVFFTWFKSPYSDGALDLVNSLGLLHFSRVVDYSDLFAFMLLPLSWWALTEPHRFGLETMPAIAPNLTRWGVFPLCLLFFTATSADEPFPFSTGTDMDCCAQEPVEVMVGNGYVYIPSAFTPDGDGINDFFQIVTDSNIIQVNTFSVFTLPDSLEVFSVDTLTDFSPTNGFDGSAFGVVNSRTYGFAIEVVAADGTTRILRNQLCALPCPASFSTGPRFLSTCHFGNQVNVQGRFDETVDAGEDLSCY